MSPNTINAISVETGILTYLIKGLPDQGSPVVGGHELDVVNAYIIIPSMSLF